MNQKKLRTHLASSALLVLAGGVAVLVVFRGLRVYRLLLGGLLGFLISAVNFWMLSKDLSGARYGSPDRLARSLSLRFLLRYLVIGAGFAVCLFYPKFSVIGFVIGFVGFQLAFFWSMFRWWA